LNRRNEKRGRESDIGDGFVRPANNGANHDRKRARPMTARGERKTDAYGETVWPVGLENDDDQFVITENIVQVWFYATEEAARRKLANLKIPPGAKQVIEETGPANHYVRGYRFTEDGEWVPPPALLNQKRPMSLSHRPLMRDFLFGVFGWGRTDVGRYERRYS
jgi:hypothetical protein